MSRVIQAQALVLESLVNHRLLPGMTHVLSLPELALSDENEEIILVDDRNVSQLRFSSRVRIITKEELENLAPDFPKAVLEFLSPEHIEEKISVRLRLYIAFPSHGLLPSSELVVTFFDRDPLSTTAPTHILSF